jgi:hypothetical protein
LKAKHFFVMAGQAVRTTALLSLAQSRPKYAPAMTSHLRRSPNARQLYGIAL